MPTAKPSAVPIDWLEQHSLPKLGDAYRPDCKAQLDSSTNKTCEAGVAKGGQWIHFATYRGKLVWGTLCERKTDADGYMCKCLVLADDENSYDEIAMQLLKFEDMNTVGRAIWKASAVSEFGDLKKERKSKFTKRLSVPISHYTFESLPSVYRWLIHTKASS